jgi:hypothetical protein
LTIDIRFRGIESSDALESHVTRRVRNHLRRFGQDLTAVVVRIADVNGPRGGVDKRCRITVRGPRFGSSTLSKLGTDAFAVVDVAVGTMAHALGRQITRARRQRAAS